jgi:hypothetical protein
MEENLNKDQMLFTSLIVMFQTAAMQHMGKIKNPMTDKIERDIEQAKISIDMLEMIQKKTDGNLTEYERKLLKSVLQELRLNYVYERDKKEEDVKKGDEQNSSDAQNENKDKQ